MKFAEAADAASKMVHNLVQRDDEANGVEYSENRTRIAVVGLRQEAAAIGTAQVYIVRALGGIRLLLTVIALELGILMFK